MNTLYDYITEERNACLPPDLWVEKYGMGAPINKVISHSFDRLMLIPEVRWSFASAWNNYSIPGVPWATVYIKGGWDGIGGLLSNKHMNKVQVIDHQIDGETVDWTHLNIAAITLLAIEVNGQLIWKNQRPNSKFSMIPFEMVRIKENEETSKRLFNEMMVEDKSVLEHEISDETTANVSVRILPSELDGKAVNYIHDCGHTRS